MHGSVVSSPERRPVPALVDRHRERARRAQRHLALRATADGVTVYLLKSDPHRERVGRARRRVPTEVVGDDPWPTPSTPSQHQRARWLGRSPLRLSGQRRGHTIDTAVVDRGSRGIELAGTLWPPPVQAATHTTRSTNTTRRHPTAHKSCAMPVAVPSTAHHGRSVRRSGRSRRMQAHVAHPQDATKTRDARKDHERSAQPSRSTSGTHLRVHLPRHVREPDQ